MTLAPRRWYFDAGASQETDDVQCKPVNIDEMGGKGSAQSRVTASVPVLTPIQTLAVQIAVGSTAGASLPSPEAPSPI